MDTGIRSMTGLDGLVQFKKPLVDGDAEVPEHWNNPLRWLLLRLFADCGSDGVCAHDLFDPPP